jgi:C-terminal processing protease CtpA/Prc
MEVVSMTKSYFGLFVALSALLASPLWAGDYEKCKADAQSCLNQMAAKLQNRGWVGIELDVDDVSGTMTVKRVVPDSPAMAAGFRTGDVLAAFNDMRYAEASDEQKQKAWESMIPGKQVSYTVLRDGHETRLDVTLGKVPQKLVAQWVGHHMLEHVTVAQAN